MDITVVEELSEPELALIECRHFFTIIANYPYLAYRGRRYVYQFGSCLHTELHTTLGSTDIHILNVCSLREVLHIGSTVEDGVNGIDC